MSTFKKAPPEIKALAETILKRFPTHQPLLDAGVKIDFVFAFGPRDDDGNIVGDALKAHGVKALGVCKIVGASDRAKGNGDAEVKLDNDWWVDASDEEREALLDHELHHIAVKVDQDGHPKIDENRRPKLRLRHHDVDVGWFGIIAQRHGAHSQECIQAKAVMDKHGQLFWPAFQPAALSNLEIVKPSRMTRAMQEVAKQVNAGALDKDGVKVTAVVT